MTAWNYEGKKVLVTGCSSGIGEATAKALADLGATVVGVDRREASVPLREYFLLDLADPTAIDVTASRIGAVDALFNCAGVSAGGWEAMDVMRVNFLGLRAFTEGVITNMPRGGAIVSVSSLGGQGWEQRVPLLLELLNTSTFQAGEKWCAEHASLLGYGLSKQALILYTKFRCVELAQQGIRINVVSPGVTQTPMLADSAKALGGEDALNRVPAPLGRRARPDEQASVLAFFNSDAASYVTGQNLWTDAGFRGGLESGVLAPLSTSR